MVGITNESRNEDVRWPGNIRVLLQTVQWAVPNSGSNRKLVNRRYFHDNSP